MLTDLSGNSVVADPNDASPISGGGIMGGIFSGIGSIMDGAKDLFENGRDLWNVIDGNKEAEDAIKSDTTPKPSDQAGFFTKYKTPIMIAAAVIAAIIIYKQMK